MTATLLDPAAGPYAEPSKSSPIELFDLMRQRFDIAARLDARIARVLDHGQFVLGPEVEELEARLAAYTGARHVIGVSSGRDALVMALMALGVGPGDAVFVPAFTFTATAGAVAAVGGAPVFVDVDESTFNMDPAALERAIARIVKQGNLRPVAVMPVDLYGLPADYEMLNAVAQANGLSVVADAAQSFGGSRNGRAVGTLAAISATSFYPTKPLGAYGDGGALFTDDDGLAAAVRQIRSHGRAGSGDEAVRLGMTGRLDTLQAAVLLVKLEVFDEELENRRQIAKAYNRALRDVTVVPEVPEGAASAWALYTIRTASRNAVRARLENAGIGTGLFYRVPLHRHRAFSCSHKTEEPLIVSERLADEVISLPIHPYLSDREVDKVICAVRCCLHA